MNSIQLTYLGLSCHIDSLIVKKTLLTLYSIEVYNITIHDI